MNIILCKCNKEKPLLTVKKDGPNKGRKFYSCNDCNFFKWDTSYYDIRNFKNGSCYRCGRWGCDAVDCDKNTDYYGNLIPDEEIFTQIDKL